MNTTSRSSPWIDSRFLTKNGSGAFGSKKADSSASWRNNSSSSSSTASRWATEKVPTPRDTPAGKRADTRFRLGVLNNSTSNLSSLDGISRSPTAVIDPGHLPEPQAEVLGLCAGDYEEPLVELGSETADQGLMLASVMPAKHSVRYALCGAQPEDTLDIGDVEGFWVARLSVVVNKTVKEGRGRQLFIIANHRNLKAANNGTKCFNGAYLAGFINHDQVESQNAWFDELREGHWRHHPNGLDELHRITSRFDELA